MRIHPGEMVKGNRYKIKLDDCCVSGFVTGTFIKWLDYENDNDYSYCAAEFDFGTLECLDWHIEPPNNV